MAAALIKSPTGKLGGVTVTSDAEDFLQLSWTVVWRRHSKTLNYSLSMMPLQAAPWRFTFRISPLVWLK